MLQFKKSHHNHDLTRDKSFLDQKQSNNFNDITMVQRTAQMKNMESEHVTVFSKILGMSVNTFGTENSE